MYLLISLMIHLSLKDILFNAHESINYYFISFYFCCWLLVTFYCDLIRYMILYHFWLFDLFYSLMFMSCGVFVYSLHNPQLVAMRVLCLQLSELSSFWLVWTLSFAASGAQAGGRIFHKQVIQTFEELVDSVYHVSALSPSPKIMLLTVTTYLPWYPVRHKLLSVCFWVPKSDPDFVFLFPEGCSSNSVTTVLMIHWILVSLVPWFVTILLIRLSL